MQRQQVEGASHAAEHAEPQHVDLHELQRVDVVLVPFDHLPVGHRGRLDRHQAVEAVAGEHEAARVLAEMARKPDQLLGQHQRQAQPAIGNVQVDRGRLALVDALLAPAPDLARELGGDVLRQSHHLADLAHGTARAVAGDGGAQGRAVAAVALEHPLDHLLAPLMLEIDVDVGRLVTIGGDEALEQQVAVRRIDRGDAEHEADRRVGGRAASLAQDPGAAGKADDGVHGQEVGGVAELPDQPELVRDLCGNVGGRALRIHHRQAPAHQPFQILLVRQAGSLAFLRILVAELRQAEAAAAEDGA